VLPKGHIEPNESPEETALRELTEEAGIIGEIVDRLPIQFFENPKEKVIVQYFLVKEAGSSPEHEGRVIRWEVEDAALELLSFEDAKMVLRVGARRVHSLGGRAEDERT
jgi:8-oxo-dGTP pyrophosphatase MutT (NUDIX family)